MQAGWLRGILEGTFIVGISFLVLRFIIPYEKIKNEKPGSLKRIFYGLIILAYSAFMIWFVFDFPNYERANSDEFIEIVIKVFCLVAANWQFYFFKNIVKESYPFKKD